MGTGRRTRRRAGTGTGTGCAARLRRARRRRGEEEAALPRWGASGLAWGKLQRRQSCHQKKGVSPKNICMVAVAEMEGAGLAERLVDHERRRLIKGLRAEIRIVGDGQRLGTVPQFRKRSQQGGGAQHDDLTIRG